jgi:hypothetical protein
MHGPAFLRSANLLPSLNEPRNTAAKLQLTSRSNAMFALTDISRNAQRTVCMLLSAVIVAASLSIGAYQAQSALHSGYSVTVTQLQ